MMREIRDMYDFNTLWDYQVHLYSYRFGFVRFVTGDVVYMKNQRIPMTWVSGTDVLSNLGYTHPSHIMKAMIPDIDKTVAYVPIIKDGHLSRKTTRLNTLINIEGFVDFILRSTKITDDTRDIISRIVSDMGGLKLYNVPKKNLMYFNNDQCSPLF